MQDRGFTLVEVMVTVAVVGIAAGLGMFVMTDVMSTAQARDSSFRFVEDARRTRADNIRQGLYTVLETDVRRTGTKVTYVGMRNGTDQETPCKAYKSGAVLPAAPPIERYYDELIITMKED